MTAVSLVLKEFCIFYTALLLIQEVISFFLPKAETLINVKCASSKTGPCAYSIQRWVSAEWSLIRKLYCLSIKDFCIKRKLTCCAILHYYIVMASGSIAPVSPDKHNSIVYCQERLIRTRLRNISVNQSRANSCIETKNNAFRRPQPDSDSTSG